ncbi:HlyC/CorC family transporter [Rhizobium sp. PP-CC-3G-465]|uniref:HlyC/CorC family transporter n=1 Tax=Rhizobium sp. PP-CC-3G-465 TaxID=2135648 RepID=UPI00104D0B33|nr:Mg2+/Co2+ transporter CorB [Rhizobium sp. PP-CC-3G-465]
MTMEALIALLIAHGPAVLAILLMIVLAAFLSGSETALTAVSRTRLHTLDVQGEARAGVVDRLIERRDRVIGALLLGSNLVRVLATSVATGLFLSAFGAPGVAYATIAMTILLVVFADVLPRSWANAAPEHFAVGVARPVRVVVAVVGPLSSLINAMVRAIMQAFGFKLSREAPMLTAHEELRGAVDFLHREGAVVKADRDRVSGVLDLDELEVSDIMVHRMAMRALNADDPPAVNVKAVLDSPYTRMPVWRGAADNIIGVLHAKDLLRALAEPDAQADTVDIVKIAQKPWYVPDATNLANQLSAFLRRKSHFAIVVDEYGEVRGLVTLEDILEEIVGDIADEHDPDVRGVYPQADGSLVVDGGVPIRDLNRALDWSLPDGEATTIAGLVIHESRTIPDERQAFTFYGKRFIVMKRVKNRITKLRIRPAEDTPAS